MAAIDPTVSLEYGSTANGEVPARATLKLVRMVSSPDDDDSDTDSEDEDSIAAFLNGAAPPDDTDEESSGDEAGPSDPSKGKQGGKNRADAAIAQLKKALAENDSDTKMKTDEINGHTSKKLDKGKAKALASLDDEDSEDELDEDEEVEEFVLCTLDPTQVCIPTL